MGKATVIESIGKGYYRINVEFDNVVIEAKKAAIETSLTGIAAKLVELGTQKTDALAKFNAADAALNDYLLTVPPEVYITDPEALADLTGKLFEARLAYDLLVSAERREKLRKTALEKDRDYLDNYCPSSIEAHAWCVAYVENLAGALKTIEVDYAVERDPLTNQIRNDTGFWLPEAVQAPDSQLQHPLASSPHATWFNLCMVPAAQRWQGRYRIAIITALNKTTNKCDIEYIGIDQPDPFKTYLLDDDPVHPQLIDTNQNYYKGANVLYMTCNAQAFEVGDKVIVDLHDGDGVPTVIGFYDNPRECWPASLDVNGAFDYSNLIYTGFDDIGWPSPPGSHPLPDYTYCPEDDGYYTSQMVTETEIKIIRTSNVIVLPSGYAVDHYPSDLTSTIAFPGSDSRRTWKISGTEIGNYEVHNNSIIDFIIRFDYTLYHVNLMDLNCLGDSSFGGYATPASDDPVIGDEVAMAPTSEYLVLRNTTSGNTKNYKLYSNPYDKVFRFIPA